METAFSLILGIVIGGSALGLAATMFQQKKCAIQISELQAAYSGRIADLEGKEKGAAAIAEERGREIEKRDDALRQVRADLDAERDARVKAITRLEAARQGFEDQKAVIEAMRNETIDSFNALSSAALRSNSEDFLRLASEHLGKVVSDTKGRLGEHQAALDGMIRPLYDTLKRYEEQIRIMEEGRHRAYGSLEGQLRALVTTQENLQKETGNLVSALRKPQVRGRWGEMQLRRVAELSGMSRHCDFTEQHSTDTEKGRVRPDMVVHLPMGREVIVDAKVSLDAYLDAVSAAGEEERKTKIERHARQVRAHMNKLASKEYWSQFRQSPEFVVLFMPGESFLSAALDADMTLIEDGIEKKVIIATPTTFVALLRAIAYGWRQEQVAKNAEAISDLGRQLYERISALVKHFEEIGSSLKKAIEAYNRAAGSMESRVLPSVRRFRDLGVTGSGEIPFLARADHAPRTMDLPPVE
jgi:DNA recombination protein RmuC